MVGVIVRWTVRPIRSRGNHMLPQQSSEKASLTSSPTERPTRVARRHDRSDRDGSPINAMQRLRAFVARYPTRTKAAKALEITPSYLRDLLIEHRPITGTILDKLGLKRVSKVVVK